MSGIKYYDVKKEPFEIFGLYEPTSSEQYVRLPVDVANEVSGAVAGLNYNTAGGRVRFATDSEVLAVSFDPVCSWGPHYTALLGGAPDIYVDNGYGTSFVGVTNSYDLLEQKHIESRFSLRKGMKEITVNLPLYGSIKNLMIGLDENAVVQKHVPYTHPVPIVYYGSSITQGACGSRAGTSYQATISRMLDCDYINLGFSGSAKGEQRIAEYMAGLKMSAFVSDYDHNAYDDDQLEATHYRLYETIREKHPDIPYFMITKPDYKFDSTCDNDRRAVIMESYIKAYKNGDRNVWFIDGAAFFADASRGECTVEGTHPTDIGLLKMANNIGDAIKNAMKW